MSYTWTLILLSLATGADHRPCRADEPRKADEKLVPLADKNHVRKASAEYLASFRRITWHYDFDTATALAKETGRPLFVIFCRAGTITDPASGKPKCAS